MDRRHRNKKVQASMESEDSRKRKEGEGSSSRVAALGAHKTLKRMRGMHQDGSWTPGSFFS
jgi:hypothetical protein